jgi:hypothetical protein
VAQRRALFPDRARDRIGCEAGFGGLVEAKSLTHRGLSGPPTRIGFFAQDGEPPPQEQQLGQVFPQLALLGYAQALDPAGRLPVGTVQHLVLLQESAAVGRILRQRRGGLQQLKLGLVQVGAELPQRSGCFQLLKPPFAKNHDPSQGRQEDHGKQGDVDRRGQARVPPPPLPEPLPERGFALMQ